MSERRPIEERIAEIDKRIEQLKARKQQLRARASQEERKQRTRRLIIIGGIMARLGVDTPEKAERLRAWIEAAPSRLATIRAIAEGTGLDGLTRSDARQTTSDEG
ncbi:MAG: relaxasome subunit MobC [Armatimonadota bacterium]|nr:relaxasome subunit MobC [Armatimonadota bacterium]